MSTRTPGRFLLLALAGLLAFLAPLPVWSRSNVSDMGGYVVVELPEDFSMRVEHRRGLSSPSHFSRLGDVVLNAQYFDIGSGCTMGTTRVNGRTVADDGRRNGRGLVWDDGPGWQMVSSGRVSRAANGMQVGPTLVEGGVPVYRSEAERVRPNVHGRARRVGIARRGRGDTVVVATRSGYTLAEFSQLLVRLGAREAIGFDGGTSTCLYVGGREYVDPGRLIPSALVIDYGTPSRSPVARSASRSPARGASRTSGRVSSPTGSGRLVEVPIPQPFLGHVEMLDPAGSLVRQVEILGAGAIVCSPDLFSPGNPRPVGALRSGGRALGTHSGPAVGYTWALDQDQKKLLLRPCNRRHLPTGVLGGCGPLLCYDGRPVSLADQGFTRGGGLIAPDRRLALAMNRAGQLVLVGTNDRLGADEFVTTVRSRYPCAIGLSGGPHAVLYRNGQWLMRPRNGATVPYVFVFPMR